MKGPSVVVIPNARLELLRCLAWYRDWSGEQNRRNGDDLMPIHVPLFVSEWTNPVEDITVAARECAALGEIEMDARGCHPNGAMVVITDLGYARIRTHDTIGEVAQEGAA